MALALISFTPINSLPTLKGDVDEDDNGDSYYYYYSSKKTKDSKQDAPINSIIMSWEGQDEPGSPTWNMDVERRLATWSPHRVAQPPLKTWQFWIKGSKYPM